MSFDLAASMNRYARDPFFVPQLNGPVGFFSEMTSLNKDRFYNSCDRGVYSGRLATDGLGETFIGGVAMTPISLMLFSGIAGVIGLAIFAADMHNKSE